MLMDNMITLLILMAFFSGLIYKAKVYPEGNPNFFDINNTVAMRAFCCIIVVMVHIPAMYQNKLQDAVGSFGYIAVSFFFMTSVVSCYKSYVCTLQTF